MAPSVSQGNSLSMTCRAKLPLSCHAGTCRNIASDGQNTPQRDAKEWQGWVWMGSGMGSSLGLAPFNIMQELLILPGWSVLWERCAFRNFE